MVKLKRGGEIKEVFCPKWLANTMVVKEKSGKWQVCVDFTDLNKTCPKDPFPIPRIDPVNGCNGWSSSDKLFGCLLRVLSDTISSN